MQKKFCPQCGELITGTNFCVKCGHSFNGKKQKTETAKTSNVPFWAAWGLLMLAGMFQYVNCFIGTGIYHDVIELWNGSVIYNFIFVVIGLFPVVFTSAVYLFKKYSCHIYIMAIVIYFTLLTNILVIIFKYLLQNNEVYSKIGTFIYELSSIYSSTSVVVMILNIIAVIVLISSKILHK